MTISGARAIFSVDQLPDKQRYDAWAEGIGFLFEVSRSRSQQGEPFYASMEASIVGSLALSRARTAEQYWQRSAWKIGRDGLDHYMIQFYPRGTQTLLWRGGEVDMPQDGGLVYDLGREMKATTSAFENRTIIIPRALLAPLLQNPDDHHLRALPANGPLVALLREHVFHLEAAAATIKPLQTQDIVQSTVHLVAACLNAASGGVDRRGSEMVPPQLILARRIIEARLWENGFGPNELAGQLGVSRSRLYEFFAGSGGVASFIRERRLSAAMSLLTGSGTQHVPISEIAERCQFTPSEFSRAFRAQYGVSPRAARHYGLLPGSDAAGNAELAKLPYQRWLRELSPGTVPPGRSED